MFWSLNCSYWKSGKGSSQIVPRRFLSSPDIEGKPLSASMPCVLDWGFCSWISLPPLRQHVPWESTWPRVVPHSILTEHRPSPRGADTNFQNSHHHTCSFLSLSASLWCCKSNSEQEMPTRCQVLCQHFYTHDLFIPNTLQISSIAVSIHSFNKLIWHPFIRPIFMD